MELREVLDVLRARWVAVVAATVVGGLLGLAFSLLTTPSYQAQVQFYVTVAGGENAAAAAYQGSLGAQQRVRSYAALTQSSEVAQEVRKATDVDRSEAQIAAATSATSDENTVILTVSVADADPKVALMLAEGFGKVLPDVINEIETPESGGPALAKLTVVNTPSLPSSPTSPNTEQNIAVGVFVGVLIGSAIAFALHLLDRRVKSKDQLETIGAAPVVGNIPFRSNEDKQKDEHIVPFKEGHSPAAEAFRRLRTNLRFLNVDSAPRTIVLTSSVAIEGKSETAVNLSLALAEAGNSVLLIEADLRRPRVVTYLSMPDRVGLTNILSGEARFDDVVQATKHDGVELLACGPLPPNPSELLSSDTARKLFSELKERYDYVLIDSPPLLPVTDGALLAGMADGALLIVRSHRTRVEQVTQAVENLKSADADLLGVVMVGNRPAKRGTAEYYDSYYYSSKAPG